MTNDEITKCNTGTCSPDTNAHTFECDNANQLKESETMTPKNTNYFEVQWISSAGTLIGYPRNYRFGDFNEAIAQIAKEKDCSDHPDMNDTDRDYWVKQRYRIVHKKVSESVAYQDTLDPI